MQTGILVICDTDQEYAKKLMEYIDAKQGLPFKTIVFTDRQELLKYAKDNHIELLLISTTDMESDFTMQNIGKIILLSSGKIQTAYMSYDSIFKYQSGENIIKEVLEYYVEIHRESGMISMSKAETKIIGVYSPVGRSGKTTFALTLGQVLASEHSAVYINMEEFSAFDKLLESGYSGDLSDLMYFFKQNPESVPIKLQAVVHNINGLDYIPPLMFCEELRNIETKEWMKLIKRIAVMGTYDRIILDLSSILANVFEMLEICDVVYMPVKDDRISQMKVADFEECVLKKEKEKLLDNIIKIQLPQVADRDWEDDYLDKQLWGKLGDFVRNLLKEDVA